MNDIINKNFIKFVVSGAIDFVQHLTIEIYNIPEEGAEEIGVNEFLRPFYDLCPMSSDYIERQVRLVATNHHFNVNKRKIWIKCSEYYWHTHDRLGNGTTTILPFSEVIEKFKEKYNGYKLDFSNGYDFKTHISQLNQYFHNTVILDEKERSVKLKVIDKISKKLKIK